MVQLLAAAWPAEGKAALRPLQLAAQFGRREVLQLLLQLRRPHLRTESPAPSESSSLSEVCLSNYASFHLGTYGMGDICLVFRVFVIADSHLEGFAECSDYENAMSLTMGAGSNSSIPVGPWNTEEAHPPVAVGSTHNCKVRALLGTKNIAS